MLYTHICYILLFQTILFLSSYLGFWNHSKLRSFRIQLFGYVNMCLHAYVYMHIDLYASITVHVLETNKHLHMLNMLKYIHIHMHVCM